MRAYDKAAIRDAKFDRYAIIDSKKREVADLESLIDELVQLQIDFVEDGLCRAAADVGKHLIQARSDLKIKNDELNNLFR